MLAKRLAAWQRALQEMWQTSICRGLLVGSFFTGWLVPQENSEITSYWQGSLFCRMGNGALHLIVKFLWWVGAKAMSCLEASWFISFGHRAVQGSWLFRGLFWWRSN